MKAEYSKIDNIISECNKQINEKIIGINYLEKLKYILINDYIELDTGLIKEFSNDKSEEFQKMYGENILKCSIKFYQNSVSKIKNKLINDSLSIVIKGNKLLELYGDLNKKTPYIINLFPKMGIVLSENTMITEKIAKDSLIMDLIYIKNNGHNINVEK